MALIAVLVGCGSAFAVQTARRIAVKKALLDLPNERSSHKQPVPRLGGAAFVPVLALAIGGDAFRLGRLDPVVGALLGGLGLLYAISLADDFLTLPTGIRFVVQLGAALVVLWAVARAPGASLDFLGAWFLSEPRGGTLIQSPWAGLSLACLAVWLVGTLNIYNFMDGIDGIAGLQAVVAGAGWAFWGSAFGAPVVSSVGLLAAAAAVGFLTLNWPPAKIFMGDAGSTVLGFVFAAAPVLAVVETGAAVPFDRLLVAGALALWPFLFDGTFTLLRRLKNGENILQAHRSHLYQRLVIAGRSHRQVTLVYGGLAVVGVVLGSRVLAAAPAALPLAAIGTVGAFLALWLWVVRTEARRRSPGP